MNIGGSNVYWCLICFILFSHLIFFKRVQFNYFREFIELYIHHYNLVLERFHHS